jgi:hypothetical protein
MNPVITAWLELHILFLCNWIYFFQFLFLYVLISALRVLKGQEWIHDLASLCFRFRWRYLINPECVNEVKLLSQNAIGSLVGAGNISRKI